jgi:hypothetical protein
MAIRIAVVANCQVASYTRCLRALVPAADVQPIQISRAKGADACAEMAARAAESDVVLTQPVTLASLGPLATDELRARCQNLHLIPKVAFSAFHPDAVHVVQAGQVRSSPTSPFSSRIAIIGFLAGLSVTRTLALYNRFIFQQLGYLAPFDRSLAPLLAQLAEMGFDDARDYPVWTAGQVFMHAPNHPRISLMAHLAATAADKASIPRGPVSDTAEVIDPLARAADWPIYGEIAQHLGVSEDLEFRGDAKSAAPALSRDQFVAQSFEIFASLDRLSLNAALNRRAAEVVASLK